MCDVMHTVAKLGFSAKEARRIPSPPVLPLSLIYLSPHKKPIPSFRPASNPAEWSVEALL